MLSENNKILCCYRSLRNWRQKSHLSDFKSILNANTNLHKIQYYFPSIRKSQNKSEKPHTSQEKITNQSLARMTCLLSVYSLWRMGGSRLLMLHDCLVKRNHFSDVFLKASRQEQRHFVSGCQGIQKTVSTQWIISAFEKWR